WRESIQARVHAGTNHQTRRGGARADLIDRARSDYREHLGTRFVDLPARIGVIVKRTVAEHMIEERDRAPAALEAVDDAEHRLPVREVIDMRVLDPEQPRHVE